MTPNGVSIGRPPAFEAPPTAVWQNTQSPSAASCAPRAMVAAENTEASGFSIGAIDRQGRIAVAIPIPPAISAAAVATVPRRLANGLDQRCISVRAGPGGAGRVQETALPPRSPAKMRSGVNGGSRKRTPVASKMALAIAAALGTEVDSPTPSGG